MQGFEKNYNSGFRGRRGGSYNTYRSRQAPLRPSSPPLGLLVQKIQYQEVKKEDERGNAHNSDQAPAHISDCELVASYNWMNQTEPTILVPGKSPLWTPLGEPKKLKEDHGDYFRDANAARYPVYSTEPAVKAVLTMHPDYSTEEVDIFACGSTFGNLLRFARGQHASFRMMVELVGNTVFLVRRENSPTELIRGIRGHGHTFPEAYTTWEEDVKGSLSHQRIVNYNFGGLNCLMRFEGDGYLKDHVRDELTISNASGLVEKKSTLNPSEGKKQTADIVYDLVAALDVTGVKEKHPATNSKLSVTKGGREIPLPALFDLKTRWIGKEKSRTLEEEIPRLWVRQIPNFILAQHQDGVFNDIHILKIQDDVNKWEAENQSVCQKLVALLKRISTYVKSHPGIWELRCQEDGKLEVRKPAFGVGSSLEDSTKASWAARKLKQDEGENSQSGSERNLYCLDSDDRYDDYGNYDEYDRYDSDESSEKDFTACSSQDCGNCGHCDY